MMIRFAKLASLALVLGFALSCGTGPAVIGKKVNRTPLDPAATEKHKALVAEGDAAFAQRADVNQLKLAIAKWDEAVKIKEDDYNTYAKLARATYLLADGWIFFETEGNAAKTEEYLKTHELGQAYADQGLRALSPDFEKRVDGGVAIEDAIMALGREAVPLLYWYDVNLGKWAKFKGIDETLRYKDRIFKIMSRVYELDPEYFYGAPDRYFGSYYAVAPTFAGGDVNKSREYFEKSLKKAPDYLATHVLMAELLAPKLDDRALFDQKLQFVLDTPANIIPEMEPEALVEKKKAEKLKAKADDLF